MFARLIRWFGRLRHGPRWDHQEMPPGAVLLNGEGSYGFEVVGHGSYQRPLAALCRGETSCRAIAVLVAHRGHSYNAHAISVSIRGHTVAHFTRGEGKRYAALIGHAARRGPVVCRASVRSTLGADERSREFRVYLDLASPSRAVPFERGR